MNTYNPAMDTEQITLPKVFQEQYGSKYIQQLLDRAAEEYEDWLENDISKPKPSVLVALREILITTTSCAEDLSSISDSSVRYAMFYRAGKLDDWESIKGTCIDIIFDKYFYDGTNNQDQDESITKQINADIEEYVKQTPDCCYDNFYQLHLDRFTESRYGTKK